MNMPSRLKLATIVMLGATSVASAQPTEIEQSPCNYSADDARRIDFLAAYQKAHAAQLAATCFYSDPAIARLNRELDWATKTAQRRNPDVDLSTLEATTGYDVCRIPAGDVASGCAASLAEAVRNYTLTMTELRKFTTRWR